MKLQTIVYVTDMERSIAWYRAVLDVEPSFTSDVWSPFPVGGATLALHRTEALGDGDRRIELSLLSERPLEEVVDLLEGRGITVERGIADETFGRSILLRDLDGNPVQVNEHIEP